MSIVHTNTEYKNHSHNNQVESLFANPAIDRVD